MVTGTSVQAQGVPFAAPRGRGWEPVAALDYNGDQASDVLWYNGETNAIAVWLMAGMRVLEKGPEIPGPSGPGWEPVGAPDMNGDGLADVVWCNPETNRMAVWLMAGTRVRERGPENPGAERRRLLHPHAGGFQPRRQVRRGVAGPVHEPLRGLAHERHAGAHGRPRAGRARRFARGLSAPPAAALSRRGRRLREPRHRRDERGRIDRLRQVVLVPRREGPGAVLLPGEGGERQRGDVAPPGGVASP